MLYFTGDVHSNIIERFSYSRHPELRDLTEDDIVFVLGDFGCPWFNPDFHFYDFWLKPGKEKEEHYKLNFLSEKPWTTIIVAGNHDNYDLIKKMPLVELGGAEVCQMYYDRKIYNNIYYIETPQFMEIQGQKLLLIPGAESHDVDFLIEPKNVHAKDFLRYVQRQERNGEQIFYRVNNFTWWKEEKINRDKVIKLLKQAPHEVDYILTHDCPGSMLNHWKKPGIPGRFIPTESELVLEELRQSVDYKIWLHGHFHHYIEMSSLYSIGLPCEGIWSLEDIEVLKRHYDALNSLKKNND